MDKMARSRRAETWYPQCADNCDKRRRKGAGRIPEDAGASHCCRAAL